MRNAGKIAVLSGLFFLIFAASGCKKKFDPTAFDGGATALASASASAVASATTPPVDSSAAADATDAGDGLAPLAEGKNTATTTTHAAATGGGASAKPKPGPEPEECGMARAWCNTKPAAERGTNQGQRNCRDFRSQCFNKGGHL